MAEIVEDQTTSFQGLVLQCKGMAEEEEDREGDFGGMEKVNGVGVGVYYI